MYACLLLLLLLLVVVPHDLTRDILNGIFGRGRSGDWGEGKERERENERATSLPLGPPREFTGAIYRGEGNMFIITELVPEQIYQG